MKNRCLPELGSKYLGKRCNKAEITTVKAKEVSKLTVEECWIREDVEDKSQIHDFSVANKNSSLRDNQVITADSAKEVADEKFDNSLALDESLDTEKSDEKLTVEQGSGKVDVNRTEADEDSTQDQKQAKRKYERGVVPKFGDWDVDNPASADGYTHIFNKVKEERRGGGQSTPGVPLNDEFHKIKTFDIRGVKSGGKGLKAMTWSRFFSVK